MSTITIPKLSVKTVRETDDETGRIGSLTRAPNGRIYAAAANDVVFSDDGGATFRLAPAVPGSPPIYGMYADASAVYLVGGKASVRRSDDGGLTWTELPIADFQANLYRIRRAPDGALWITGDQEHLFTSTDGLHFALPEARKDREAERPFQRYLDVFFEDGAMLCLSSRGTIDRVRGKEEERLSLAAHKPLTTRALYKGTWLVFGDAGTAWRSTDGGKTFAHLPLPVKGDLEDAVVTERGVFVVGDETVLFSADGETFAKVPTELSGHLWSALAVDGGILVSGDDGLIAKIEVSETETMTVPLLPAAHAPAVEEEDEDDEDDEDDSDEEASEAKSFTLEEASARWKREGREFITGLNAYVRACYSVGPNKAGKEPQETREDMADFVRQKLVELNEAGEHERARALFPPAYEPFDYESLGTSIDAVAFLGDARRLVACRGEVYVVTPGKIEVVPELRFFGRSSDKKLWAKVYADRIDVHREWDGPKVGSLAYDGAVEQLVLTPEGDAALIAGGGVHWVHASGTRELKDDASYCHVAMSPNGRFLAYGTQDTAHLLLDRKTGEEHAFNPVSSYPHFAFFHHDAPKVVFSSCHALYGSGSMVVDVERVAKGQPSSVSALDRRAWVHSGIAWGDRLLLGDRSGYVWAKKPGDDEATWYLFLGSTLTALDVSQDGKRLLVGSYSGHVVELELGAEAPDPTLLTNGPVKETARWLFWQGHPPLIW